MIDSHHIEQSEVLHHPQVAGLLEMRHHVAIVQHVEDGFGHWAVVGTEDSQSTTEFLAHLMGKPAVFQSGVVADTVCICLHFADVTPEVSAGLVQENRPKEVHLIWYAVTQHAADEV